MDVDGEMPEGIGVWEQVTDNTNNSNTSNTRFRSSSVSNQNWILIDPMTGETISKEPVLNREGKQVLDDHGHPLYKTHDHWFVLNAKFLWRDAPEPPKQAVTSPYGMPMQRSAPRSPSTSSSSSKKSNLPDMDM